MDRARYITHEIKKYDSKLFCKRHYSGILAIYRHDSIVELYELDSNALVYYRPVHKLIMPLTENWNFGTRPVHWGVDVIINRLKEIDGHNRDVVGELVKNYEKKAESNERHLQNETEAFAKDFRRQFARTFNDYNVSTLDKKLDKRRLKCQ